MRNEGLLLRIRQALKGLRELLEGLTTKQLCNACVKPGSRKKRHQDTWPCRWCATLRGLYTASQVKHQKLSAPCPHLRPGHGSCPGGVSRRASGKPRPKRSASRTTERVRPKGRCDRFCQQLSNGGETRRELSVKETEDIASGIEIEWN